MNNRKATIVIEIDKVDKKILRKDSLSQTKLSTDTIGFGIKAFFHILFKL